VSYSPPPAEPAALPPRAWCLHWVQRVAMVLAGGVLVALLVTASRLTPSPRWMGTHQQLGLPPCTMVQWFGLRCPSCGMTTSWAHLTRGHLLASLRANSGGTLLGIASVVCGPWLLVSGLLGRWIVRPPSEWVTLAAGLAIIGVTLIDWAIRLTFLR